MNVTAPELVLQGDTLEVHFYFHDETHTMDAFVHNRAEHELLHFASEVARVLDFRIEIETIPLDNGGRRTYLKFLRGQDGKFSPATIAFFVSLITALLINPIGHGLEKLADKVLEDPQKTELEKQKLQEEVKGLQLDNEKKRMELDESKAIQKRRSNFYQKVDDYPKITTVSFTVVNDEKKPVSKEHKVQKADFKKYILATNDLEPLEIEGAEIELISPVLKKGKYQWRGIYQGDVISFSMGSAQFKQMVQSGEVEFKNGFTMRCLLEISRRLDNEGNEAASGYKIIRVDSYYENDTPVETPEGKHHRKVKEAEKQQLNIPFGANG